MRSKLQTVRVEACALLETEAPVIHMVIVRGPARAEPRISSPVPLSGFYCQLREERRVCLLACFCFISGFLLITVATGPEL